MPSVDIVNTLGKALTSALKKYATDEVHIAIGSGETNWGVTQTKLLTFSSNLIDVSDTNIEAVVVKSNDTVITYDVDVDYSVDPATGIITRIAEGDIANDAEVSVSYNVSLSITRTETELNNEIGRKQISGLAYVVADTEGLIQTDTGTWTLSATPTNHILFQVSFIAGEATGTTIREFGIFVETELAETITEGQVYFPIADVVDGGIMLLKQKQAPITKDAVTEVSRNYVITLGS